MIDIVIVDDESRAIESLKWELSSFDQEINVINTFTSPEEAITFLQSNKVDCVFLDIEMPTMDGFQFLEKFPNRNFEVVISTAYNEYGIKALKNEVLDYLLKPIDSDDLEKTIEKLRQVDQKSNQNNGLEKVEQILLDFNEKLKRKKVVISIDGKLMFLKPSDIAYVESDGNYSSIYLTDNKKIVITKKLKEVNELLPEDEFFRIHNSYIINLDKIIEFYKTDGYVVLEGNIKIPVSRQRKSEFLDKF